MRTLQEKYNGIQEGKFSKEHFLAEARMQQPQIITRFNGYDDAVQILKNKGMIQEAKVDTETLKDVLRGGKKIATGVRFLNAKDYKDGNKTSTLEKGDQVLDSKETVKEAFSKVWDKSKLTKTTYEDGKYHSSEKFKTVEDLLADKEKTDAIQKRREEKGKPKTDHILKEAKLTKKSLTDYRYKPTNDMDKYPYEQILRGIRVELETLGVHGTPTAEEYSKALAKVSKNLAKDSIFYTNQLAGFNPNKKRTDVMTPVDQKKIFKTNGTKGEKATDNKDIANGMKKVPVTTNFTIVKEGIKKVIKSILNEDEDWDKSGRHIEYGTPEHGDEDDLYDLYGNDEENLEEGPAQNNPKIQKIVDGINDLIRQAKDSDGDPIGVVEPGGTWEEPEMYSPIEYRNGALKITKMSPYKGIPSTDVIKAGNMEYDGIPTLRLIMRMYKKAVKKAGQDAYPDENLDEASQEEETADPLRDYKQATEQVTEGKTRVNDLFAALDAKGLTPEQIQDTAFLAKKIDNIMWTLNDVADNPEELAKRYQDRVSNISEDTFKEPQGTLVNLKQLHKLAMKAGNFGEEVKESLLGLYNSYGDRVPIIKIKETLSNYDLTVQDLKDQPATFKPSREFAHLFNSSKTENTSEYQPDEEEDDISHPRGYKDATDAETEKDLYKTRKAKSLSELLN